MSLRNIAKLGKNIFGDSVRTKSFRPWKMLVFILMILILLGYLNSVPHKYDVVSVFSGGIIGASVVLFFIEVKKWLS